MSIGMRLLTLIAALGCAADVAQAVDSGSILVPPHGVWKYHADPNRPPDEWSSPSFDDRGWKLGSAGFGFGDGDDQTVLNDMPGRYTSVYLRTTFEWPASSTSETLYLYIKFDDGFVAYVNGTEVAASAVSRVAGRLRVTLHEADGFEPFVLPVAARLLKPGTNVLAVEGHNADLRSSDFSLDPFLTAKEYGEALDVGDYQADFAEFEQRLQDQSSYWPLRPLHRQRVQHEARMSFRDSFHDEMHRDDFVLGLRKHVMGLGDCHADVASDLVESPEPSLPLRLADTEAGIIALQPDRDGMLDPQHPILESLDGIGIERWLATAAQFVPDGSPQLVRRRSLRWLGRVAVLRRELGLADGASVTIGLRNRDAIVLNDLELPLTKQKYSVAEVRFGQSRRLEGNIGYLRVPSMDDALIEPTLRTMAEFRDTLGLIVDVRGNEGGTYGILRALYGYFVPDVARPYVTNIAAYRLSNRFSPDHLAYRPTYRADWPQWNAAERDAIRQAAEAFQPERSLPEGKFSQWHYMILSRERSGRPVTEYFHYDQPVIVLCDAGSFSATDGFLAAFAELPRVTLLGEPSAGGSGAVRRFLLPRTLVNVSLSSMASFRPNGQLYDGRGIDVDIRALPHPEDFTLGTDSVLERALSVARQQVGK